MSLRLAWRPVSLYRRCAHQVRRAATNSSNEVPQPLRHETIETCPEPTCVCAATPEMPEGLPIDTTSKMSLPYYDRHVVLAGDLDAQAWPSKLELDENSPVRKIKSLLGPKGEFYRPDFSVSVTASTLPAPSPKNDSIHAFIFPDFVRTNITDSTQSTAPVGVDLKSFGKAITNDKAFEANQDQAITSPVILICGHGQRDQRCGILGPVLQAEFERQLSAFGEDMERGSLVSAIPFIGQVSHIGGHKFAGNVIIYMPPNESRDGKFSSLAGKAIWYGRVEPRHVQGIINETIHGGRIIAELLRGVHDFGRPSQSTVS